MDKDEYAVLRARIQKKAEEDVTALDRAWQLMNGFLRNEPVKAMPKTNGHKTLTKQILSAAPPHPAIFTIDDILKKYPSYQRIAVSDVLNRFSRKGQFKCIKRGKSGKGGFAAEYQLNP